MPPEFSRAVVSMEYGLEPLTFVNAAGQKVVRPPGLFDTPGAVSGPATFAGLLGLIFFILPMKVWKRASGLAIAVVGLAAIYLSHVRTSAIVLGIMALSYVGLLLLRRQYWRAWTLLGVAGGVFYVAFAVAVLVGGGSITERFSTLTEDDPVTVYYNAARGEQLEYAFSNLLVNYPFGAGLARWGMMRANFGDESNANSPMIWAELQPNAWILVK